jgi:hypothetical protein
MQTDRPQQRTWLVGEQGLELEWQQLAQVWVLVLVLVLVLV